MVLVAVALKPAHAHSVRMAPHGNWSEKSQTGAEGNGLKAASPLRGWYGYI